MSPHPCSSTIKQRINFYLRRIPYIQRQLDFRRLRQLFPVEFALYEGRPIKHSDNPSILHFSINKAATQYVKSLLFQMGEANGLKPAALHDLAFNSSFPYLTDFNQDSCGPHKKVFIPSGFVYSVFSGSITWIDNIDQYRILIMVRDPRDIVTSAYFSDAYSHAVPPETNWEARQVFLKKREAVQKMDINDYVLKQVAHTREAMINHMALIQPKAGTNHPPQNVLVTKYETMTNSFSFWLDEIAEHCKFQIQDDLRAKIIEKSLSIKKATASGERVDQHIRKAQPGDFKHKLRPDVINELNKRFEDILASFGYST